MRFHNNYLGVLWFLNSFDWQCYSTSHRLQKGTKTCETEPVKKEGIYGTYNCLKALVLKAASSFSAD